MVAPPPQPPDSSLGLLRLSVHAGLPGVAGHVGHGEEEEGNAGEEEQHKAAAGTGEGPTIVVLYPDRLLALDHPLHRLPHYLQRDESTQAWGGEGHKSTKSGMDPGSDPDLDQKSESEPD